ncbi:hypothetical protein CDAR_613131 [Caerostris darwini]|uniref:Uncharacterized protein n=1 Tax=Caerostris darwini TaxID=1538125 RepID=A0AAV4UKX8_9ARAC|nr:hypothetical protein CDAR_613131 [Caerostris darwini]
MCIREVDFPEFFGKRKTKKRSTLPFPTASRTRVRQCRFLNDNDGGRTIRRGVICRKQNILNDRKTEIPFLPESRCFEWFRRNKRVNGTVINPEEQHSAPD